MILRIILVSILYVFSTSLAFSSDVVVDIHEMGADPQAKVASTQIIQHAIDSVSAQGGGIVKVPRGTYLTGTIFIKSNVDLRLMKGAILLASTNLDDYQRSGPYLALIFVNNQHNVSLSGLGEINGRGQLVAREVRKGIADREIDDPFYSARPFEINRPLLLYVNDSRHIKVTGITLRNAANWVSNYVDSEDVLVDGITIESTHYWNNDGIQITNSKNMRVTNNFINTADDGICFKSGDVNGVGDAYGITENVYVGYNTVRSSANAVKFGTSSYGTYRNIVIEHIEVYDTFRSAVAIESVDGGLIDNIRISHIRAMNTGNAIFIRLGDRTNREPGEIKNITISDMDVQVPLFPPDEGYSFAGPLVTNVTNLIPSSIVGLPGHRIQNVTLENINLVFAGGGRKEFAYVPLDSLQQVPELPGSYPEFSMFGELPAYGFFIRHAENITLRNVAIELQHPDYHPAITTDDVQGITIEKLQLHKTGDEIPLWFHNTEGVKLRDNSIPVSKKVKYSGQ